MGSILILALNDLRLTFKDRPVIFWMIIMPVAFIFIFSHMGGDGTAAPRVTLGVVDEDQSFLSQALRDALCREGFDVHELRAADADSAAALPRSMRIPAGLRDSVAAGRPVDLMLGVNPRADSEYTLTAEMHIQRAIIETLINLIETTRRAGAVMDVAFADTFALVAAESIRVGVSVETAGRGRPVPSGMGQSLPAMITLFMLINTGIYGAVILTQERQERILARLATRPISRTAILAGKLLGRTLLALLQAAILLAAGRFLMNAYLGENLAALGLLILCLALTVAAMALFWGAVLRRVEQANSVTLTVSLFLGAIGGCWWPLEVVPAWMRVVGHISPAAWAMDGFHALISFGAGPEAIFLPCLLLLGYAAVFTILGARLLRWT